MAKTECILCLWLAPVAHWIFKVSITTPTLPGLYTTAVIPKYYFEGLTKG